MHANKHIYNPSYHSPNFHGPKVSVWNISTHNACYRKYSFLQVTNSCHILHDQQLFIYPLAYRVPVHCHICSHLNTLYMIMSALWYSLVGLYISLYINVSWNFLRASHCQEDDTFTPTPSTYKSLVLKEFFTAALVRSMFGHLLLPTDTKLQWKPLTVNAILPFGRIYLLVDSGQNRSPISENRKYNRI